MSKAAVLAECWERIKWLHKHVKSAQRQSCFIKVNSLIKNGTVLDFRFCFDKFFLRRFAAAATVSALKSKK